MSPSTSSGAWRLRLQNMLLKVSQTSRESWQLARACSALPARSSENVKRILLQHAQMHNQVAVRILLMEKEWGLFKYHGANGYLQQKWSSRSMLLDNKPNFEQENIDRKDDETAQIAFMITSRMKQQLQEELGYSETIIKSMTPLQASLVLKHQVIHDEYNVKLSKLEQDYHTQQEQKMKEEQEQRLQKEQEEKRLAAIHETFPASTESSRIPPQTLKEVSSPSAAPEVFSADLPSRSTRITWYEVIQTQPNGEETKLGLYKTLEEAQEGVDALKYIREKKRLEGTDFSIRPSLR